jgi:hypothetical protein
LTADDPDELLAWLGSGAGRLRTLAEIWATVDLERSLAEFRTRSATATASAAGAIVNPGGNDPPHAADDPLLGARVLVLTTDDGRQIALAEPSTEGRLAATLARHGEAHVGAYVEAPVGLDVVAARAATAQIPLSRPAVGPFGQSVLVLPGRGSSRHLILVERPAVPSPA